MVEKERAGNPAQTVDDANLRQNSEINKDSQDNLQQGVDNLMNEYNSLSDGKEESEPDIPFFIVKSANDVLAEVAAKEPARPLWLTLWYEGQICCLFADSGSGKSIYAVQMGVAIAQTRKVLYFDFELSNEQFADRYSEAEAWDSYRFPDNFNRVEINANYLATHGMADVLNEIEKATLNAEADTIIIDNLTWVATTTEKAEDAGRIMQRFMLLKKVYKWSILILAHTPKREKQMPRTENDLAGSKVLYNFLDSSFSIGQSQRGEDYRYIIELKTRKGAKSYGRNNVIVTQIVKENCFTHHKTIGYSTEDLELGIRNKNHATTDELRATFECVRNKEPMRYCELTAYLQQNVKKSNGDFIGERTAKNRINQAVKDGVIFKNSEKKYEFSAVVQK